jgi:hypothetical protein
VHDKHERGASTCVKEAADDAVPAASDTVCDSDKLVGLALLLVVLDEVGEHISLDDVSVDSSNTVDLHVHQPRVCQPAPAKCQS